MFKPVLGYAAVLCIALLGFVHAADNCPSSANACVNEYKEDFDKLSQQDTSYYCEQGAKIAAKAQNCLKRCGFSEDHAVLQQEKKKINSFCKGVDAKCDAVCDTFVNQTRSFDNDGGLDAVMTALKTQFSNGEAINCVKFYNGRYLQKTQTCPFNARLDISIVQENPVILLGLAICGSETLKSLVPYVDATDGCKPNAEKTIIEKCNVSCPMANAQDPRTLCGYMEYQAKCLEENTAGCTNLQKKLVLPRLNSYAIANRYLGCSINFTGLPVKSTRKGCNYSEPINACMLTKKPENSLNFFALQPLLNFDTLVGEFCSSKKTQADMIIACRNAFIPCAPVQAKVLTTSDMSSIASFMPELGVAPLDQFGMQYIYDAQIPATCPPGLKWSERICIPDNKRDYDDKSIQTTEEKKESKSTKVSRSTPPGQTTPPKKTHGTTPKKGANDFQHQTSKGNGYTQVNGYTPTKKATKKRVDDFEIRTTEVHKPGNPQHLSSKELRRARSETEPEQPRRCSATRN